MNPLAKKIKDLIVAKGAIPFSEYMALCLFDSEYGYYSKLTHIGRGGDFITAPELGPYFAEAIGYFLMPALAKFKAPVILELGGGTGQLAFDLLHYLQARNALPPRYIIFDKSPSLMALQQKKLAEFPNVEWVEKMTEMNLQGVILANEFFDALPVERFVKTKAGAKQSAVIWDGTQFMETETGERFEKCLILPAVLKPILSAFKSGLALVIDYGDEVINHSTLTAYHGHQVVSPFENPGEADITAHVDFTAVAEYFMDCGWSIDFLKPQSQFLLEQGILPETGLNADNYALKRLLDPRLMGQLFKVMLAHMAP